MKLEIIQHTLKCKQELDTILESLERIRILMFNNDLDEVFQETMREIESLRLLTINTIESLNKAFNKFVKDI